jgi:hypothetical protein
MNHQGLHAGRAVLSSSNSSTSSSSYYSVSSLTDHLQFMQQQEFAYCITKEYLAVGAIAVVSPSTTTTTTAETIAITNVNGTTTTASTDDSTTSIKITPHDRRTLYEWSYQIVDSFMVDRSVACIGMSYLDRYMSNTSSTSLNNTRAIMALYSRREYQLVLISSLIIALKCHAGIKISLPFMANTLCRGLYTEDEIEIMEMDILHTLAWKLYGPCPHDFIDVISDLVLASSYVPTPVRAAVASAVLPRPYSDNNEDDVDVPSNESVVVQVSPTTAATRSSRSYLNVAAMAKVYVEEAMLDYSRSGLQPSSALAIEALVATLQQRTSELNPVDVMAWTSTIALFSANNISNSTSDTGSSNMSFDQDCNNNNFVVNNPTNKVGGIDESSPSSLTTSSHAVDDVNNQDYKLQKQDDQCHPTTSRKASI